MRKPILMLLCLLVSAAAFSQMGPVQWKFYAQRLDDTTYAVHCKARIDGPYHIYSSFADSNACKPTTFKWNFDTLHVKAIGSIQEIGNLKEAETLHACYDGEVDFVQIFNLVGVKSAGVSAKIEWMPCFMQCLPEGHTRLNLTLGSPVDTSHIKSGEH